MDNLQCVSSSTLCVNLSFHLCCAHLFVLFSSFKLSDIDYPKSKNLDQFLNKTGLSVQYSPIFKKAVNFNGSAIHVPTDVYDGGIYWTL